MVLTWIHESIAIRHVKQTSDSHIKYSKIIIINDDGSGINSLYYYYYYYLLFIIIIN